MTYTYFTDLEKLLDANRKFTIDTVKAEFRKLCLQYHPDKGGDSKSFRELQAEYQEISKRAINGETFDAKKDSPEFFADFEDFYNSVNEICKTALNNTKDIAIKYDWEISLVGVYIHFNNVTKEQKEELKEACKFDYMGDKYNKPRKVWASWHKKHNCWVLDGRLTQYKVFSRKSSEEIKATYGETKVNFKSMAKLGQEKKLVK